MNKFLQLCADIEDLAAQIYRELERQSAGNERLEEIMRRMALDEEDHARQLRFALRVSPKDTFEGISESTGDPHALKLRAKQLLLQAKEATLSEYELLKVAVELENDFHKIHTSSSLLFKDPTMKKMFASLARADQLHVADLHHYLRDYKAGLSSSHDGKTGG
jgi:rubrerythrin